MTELFKLCQCSIDAHPHGIVAVRGILDLWFLLLLPCKISRGCVSENKISLEAFNHENLKAYALLSCLFSVMLRKK